MRPAILPESGKSLYLYVFIDKNIPALQSSAPPAENRKLQWPGVAGLQLAAPFDGIISVLHPCANAFFVSQSCRSGPVKYCVTIFPVRPTLLGYNPFMNTPDHIL
ncbi:MAG TPA: hypothetical protein VJ417_06575, partial [Candidatus Glassbacteria bacterium]|nr:hypothetical protein [Candidatus Glassbacteria bacterium]